MQLVIGLSAGESGGSGNGRGIDEIPKISLITNGNNGRGINKIMGEKYKIMGEELI